MNNNNNGCIMLSYLAGITLFVTGSATAIAAPAWLQNNMSGFSCSTPAHRQAGRGFRSPYRFRPVTAAHPTRMARRYRPTPVNIRSMPAIHSEPGYIPRHQYQRMQRIDIARSRQAFPRFNSPIASQNSTPRWRRYPFSLLRRR